MAFRLFNGYFQIYELVMISQCGKFAHGQNIFVEFGHCDYEPCKQKGQECCLFDDNIDQEAYFCMTQKQKGGKLTGTYIDSDQTKWTWDCNIDESKITRPQDELDGKGWLPQESYRKPDEWMEWVILITFLSGLLGIFGYTVMIQTGTFAYFGWIQYWCWFGLY